MLLYILAVIRYITAYFVFVPKYQNSKALQDLLFLTIFFLVSSLSSVSSWTTTAPPAACPSTRRSPGRASTSSWSQPPPYRRPAASSSSTTRCPALPHPPPVASPGPTGPSSPSTSDNSQVAAVETRPRGTTGKGSCMQVTVYINRYT